MRSTPLSIVLLTSLTLSAAPGCKKEAPRADTGASASATTSSPPVTVEGSTGEVTVGKPAPDFATKDQNGADVKLSSFKGKPVVVYFYPKDETPGCTTEAKDFRDTWKDLEKKGVVVIGVSTDSADSHKAFATHHGLPFHLVSDEGGAIAKAFGVPVRLGFMARQTFLIDADGNVKKIYRHVDLTKHASDVLADFQS
jgi:peroxiredoxin Q/BCP